MKTGQTRKLADRVITAAEAALAAKHYVSPLDILLGIGWLDPNSARRWRQGQLDHLERAVQANPSRVSEAMALLQSWAEANGLKPSETDYVDAARRKLRFSASETPAIELLYRTHWVSGKLSERQRDRLAEKADRPPEVVAVLPLKSDWKCHRCGGSGDYLVMENPGPACLRCVGLGDLEFVPAGNTLLTRRVKAKSARCAIVVRFSKARRRYERQGILAETAALADAQRELGLRRS
jgi:hypothetical protein